MKGLCRLCFQSDKELVFRSDDSLVGCIDCVEDMKENQQIEMDQQINHCYLCLKEHTHLTSDNECVNCHEQMKYDVNHTFDQYVEAKCYLCDSLVFTGDRVCDVDGSVRFVCEPCLRKYTIEELQEEFKHETLEKCRTWNGIREITN